jgi:hypothetical protein
MPDGRILVAGGIHGRAPSDGPTQPASATCEIYDPATDTWTYTGALPSARNFVRLVTLDNNGILAVGGEVNRSALNDCAAYDVMAGTWSSVASMNTGRLMAEILKLPNGDVLTAGGWSQLWSSQTPTVERYDVANDAWGSLSSLATERGWHTATMLDNGDIFVAGGTTASNAATRKCEIFRFESSGSFSLFAVSDMPSDEGGYVTAYWTSHPGDAAMAQDKVVSYGVLVRDDVEGQEYDGLDGLWRQVGSVNAAGHGRYSAVVTTPRDGTPDRHAYSMFVVLATTASGKTYTSKPNIGESFDNRGPSLERRLTIARVSGGLKLEWSKSQAADLHEYAIYRGETPGFALNRNTLVGTTSDLSYIDNPYGANLCYYRVRAVDNTNNPGLATPPVGSNSVSGVPNDPTGAVMIGNNYPQPFSSTTSIPVTLTRPATVTVNVYDNLSRQVMPTRTLELGPGAQSVNLSAAALPSGRYTAVVNAGGVTRAITLVVQK